MFVPFTRKRFPYVYFKDVCLIAFKNPELCYFRTTTKYSFYSSCVIKFNAIPPLQAITPDKKMVQQLKMLLGNAKKQNSPDKFAKCLETFIKDSRNSKKDIESAFLQFLSLDFIESFSRDPASRMMKCFGMLNMRYDGDTANSDILMSFVDHISTFTMMSPFQLKSTLMGMQQCGINWRDLSSEQQTQFYTIIKNACIKTTPFEYSSLLLAITKLDILWSDIPLETQHALLNDFILNSSVFTLDNGGALAVTSFGKLMLPANTLNTFFIKELYMVIERLLIECCNEQCIHRNQWVCSIFTGMAKMELKYEQFPTSLQILLVTIMEKNLKLLDARAVSTVFYAYGQFGVPYSSITPAGHHDLQRVLAWAIPEMIDFNVANTLVGLGRMNAKYSDLFPKFRKTIHSTLSISIPKMNSQTYNSTIRGLSHLQVNWSELPQPLCIIIDDNLVAKFGSMTDIEVVTTLSSFSHMQMKFSDDFSVKSKNEIFNVLEKRLKRLNANWLAKLFDALGRLQVTWCDMPLATRTAVEKCFMRTFHSMNPDQVTWTMIGMEGMKVSFADLSEELQLVIKDVLVHKLSNVPDELSAETAYMLSNLNFGVNNEHPTVVSPDNITV